MHLHLLDVDMLDRSSAKKRMGFDLPVSSLCMPLCLPSVKSARMSFACLPMNNSDKHYLCVLLAHSDDQATDALCVDQTMLNYSYAGATLSCNAHHVSSATTALCSVNMTSNKA